MRTDTSLAEATERAIPAPDQLYHAVRGPAGRWPGRLQLVDPGIGEGPAGFAGASAADLHGALTLVAVGTDGDLYFTEHDRDGGWHPFVALGWRIKGGPADFYAASCAAVGDELHVVAHGSDGRLYHVIRDAEGDWQDRFEPVDAQIYCGPGGFTSSACAGIGGSLHLIALDGGRQLHHTVRHEGGAWDEFRGLMRGRLYDAPSRFAAVDCAALDGSLQIVGVGCDGQLYHTVRLPDGSWQRYFGVLGGQRHGDEPRFVLSVGCAAAGHALEVVAIRSDYRLFDSIRGSDGSWREFRSVVDAGAGAGQPGFYDVTCASTKTASHLVCGTWQGGFA